MYPNPSAELNLLTLTVSAQKLAVFKRPMLHSVASAIPVLLSVVLVILDPQLKIQTQRSADINIRNPNSQLLHVIPIRLLGQQTSFRQHLQQFDFHLRSVRGDGDVACDGGLGAAVALIEVSNNILAVWS